MKEDWAIATDLDGTLLDRSYDLDHAARVLNQVRADYDQISQIVLATSKTLVELEPLAARCERPPVLIYENGAGWARCDKASTVSSDSNPAGSGYESSNVGADYGSIRNELLKLREQRDFRFTGFGDMEAAELCALTGLSATDAVLAQTRGASEPLLWNESNERLQEFRTALKALGLSLVRGGQFLHVSEAGCDKAHALKDWQAQHAPATRIIACGDAPNDLLMLQAADRAIVFPGGDKGPVLASSNVTTHARKAGPDGWQEAVCSLLDSLVQGKEI